VTRCGQDERALVGQERLFVATGWQHDVDRSVFRKQGGDKPVVHTDGAWRRKHVMTYPRIRTTTAPPVTIPGTNLCLGFEMTA
jgi:hypothetical protein